MAFPLCFEKILCLLLFLCAINLCAQDADHSTPTDSITQKKKPLEGLLALPAISYSPETSLTMGAVVLYNFELGENIRKSTARVLAIYTLKKQLIMEIRWDLFTKNENYVIQGRSFFHSYPDRNYGTGNDAGALVAVFDEEKMSWTDQNYLNYKTKRLHFSTVLLRKIRKNLYAGLDYDFASLYDYQDLDDIFLIQTPERFTNPATGIRSGLGAHLYYDSRDNIINAYKGYMLKLSNRNYVPAFGSQKTFYSLELDFRVYKELWKDQVLAFNFKSQNKFTKENIPIRALGRMGGADFVKGYFFGTYQDNNLFAFQSEFRSTFLRFPKFPVLKGIGAAAFFNGGRSFHNWDEFSLKDIRFSVGGGIRLVFLPEDRTNIGIDYAIGLHKGSGLGKRQSGIYFMIGETF